MVWTTCRLNSSQSGQQDNDGYEDDIKNKILAAALPFVGESGWSKDAISAGATSIGYPGITHGLFTKGGADLVHYFQRTSNVQLVELLKQVCRLQRRKIEIIDCSFNRNEFS